MPTSTICDYCHTALAVDGSDYCQYCIDRKRHEEREFAQTQTTLEAWSARGARVRADADDPGGMVRMRCAICCGEDDVDRGMLIIDDAARDHWICRRHEGDDREFARFYDRTFGRPA